MRANVLMLFICSFMNSQEHAFEINVNGGVEWIKVFEIPGDSDEIISNLTKYFKNQEFTRKIELIEGEFRGYSNPIKVKPIKGGPSYNETTSFVNVQIKDGRYRVVISDIIFAPVDLGLSTGGISINSEENIRFDEIVLKPGNKEFRSGFSRVNIMKSFDQTFEQIMTYKKSDKDDW